MNTGYQRSSTTTRGSRTSTTPLGSVISGKPQEQKYMPLIMAMHNITYCATASPSHMKDFIEKIQKGLAASKEGFAYIHVFSPCPTDWAYKSHEGISIARRAVKSNMFPLWECKNGTYRLNDTNPKPIPVSEFVKGIGKFKALSDTAISEIQHMVDARFELLKKLSES